MISIFNDGKWNGVDMDKMYEDKATYQELVNGICELLK